MPLKSVYSYYYIKDIAIESSYNLYLAITIAVAITTTKRTNKFRYLLGFKICEHCL